MWRELEEEVGPAGKRARGAEGGAAIADASASVRGGAESRSALELVKESTGRGVVTFVAELDKLLGTGVALGQVTEFVGVPGVGKTQLCMQLSVDVQIPRVMGGVEGRCVYVDTEGSLVASRLLQIAQALVDHLKRVAERSVAAGIPGGLEQVAAVRDRTAEDVLDRISVIRCTDAATLVATCATLCDLLSEPHHADTKLVIVDTVAFPFRQTLDARVRSAGLVSVARDLKRLAASRDVAVVVVNQMTSARSSTAFPASSSSSSSSAAAADEEDDAPPAASGAASGQLALVPALGPAWAHEVDGRVLLHFAPGGVVRLAKLVKSATQPEGVAAFAVCEEGVRRPQPLSLADAAALFRPT